MSTTSTQTSYINENLKPSLIVGSILAGMNSKKLASRYPIWNIANKEARTTLEEWAHAENFHLQLKKTFFMSSKNGKAHWVLTKINNEWKLIVTNRVLFKTTDSSEKIIEGVVYARVIKGQTRNFWLYEKHTNGVGIERIVTWTNIEDKEIIHDPAQAYKNGTKTNTTDMYFDTGIFVEPFVDTKGTNTLFCMANAIDIDAEGNIMYLPDSYLAKSDIDIWDSAWANLKYVLRFARPRLIITKEHGAEIKTLDGEDYKEADEEKYLSHSSIVINSSMSLDGENGAVNVYIPNPQVLDSARKEYKEAIVAVLTRAGYAGNDDSDSAQKSAVEVAQIRDSEFSSMEDKISLFQNMAKEALMSLGKLLGIEITHEDGIDIQRLDVREQMEMLDNLIKAVDAGFDDIENAVAKYRGVSKSEASGIIKKIKKEKEEKAKEAIDNSIEEIDNEEVDKKVDKKVDNGLTKEEGNNDGE